MGITGFREPVPAPAGSNRRDSRGCIYLAAAQTPYQGISLADSLLIEGGIIGSFVILNGVWVVGTPPAGDEPQGYAIIAIGIFILLLTYELVQRKALLQEESP